ncbi:MAG: DoxX family protein [Saprospiraceae bacterium]
MQLYGVTWNLDFLLTGAIILLFLGSTLVLIGYYSNIGAIMLLIYFVPTTFIIYSFWNDPVSIRKMQSINFMRNLTMIGGLIMLIVNKPGNYSVKRLIYVMRLPR